VSSLRVALVGAGQMGANHARVVAESSRATLGVVIDVDPSSAHQLAHRYGVPASVDVTDAIKCDAAILATSTSAHAATAMKLLEEGIPLLIEKPIATNENDVDRVCAMSKMSSVPITCGFVERFNPVLDATMNLLTEDPIHIVTLRHSPLTPRIGDSVIYDLLIHDIDLALRFMEGHAVTKVTGVSWSPGTAELAEVADCSLLFRGGGVATLSASRFGQRKLRSVQIFTPTTLAELDLLRSDLTIYRHVRHEQPDDLYALTYRSETIIDIPFVRHAGEPLARQFDHFLDLVSGRTDPADEIATIVEPHRIANRVESACLIGRDV
jgi:predicted dehydrogenase